MTFRFLYKEVRTAEFSITEHVVRIIRRTPFAGIFPSGKLYHREGVVNILPHGKYRFALLKVVDCFNSQIVIGYRDVYSINLANCRF